MLFGRMGTDLAIDLGTATVLVHLAGKGIVLKEPSVVAIDKNTNKVISVGEEARRMIGRTPGNIVAVRPLRDGVISNYDITEKMLKHFIQKSCGKRKISAPKVMICIPSKATEVEKRAVVDAAKNSGAKSVFLIEEPLAAAVGAGLDISKPSGTMVIDIGGGTTDIAVISLKGVVERASIKVAGDKFDEAITRYIRKKYMLMIGEKTAEEVKISTASALKGARNKVSVVKGRNLVTGLPYSIDVRTNELVEALDEPLELILDKVHHVLEKTPPELSADIMEKGILLTGGGALLHGLDKLIEFQTGVKVSVAEGSVECVVLGSGRILSGISKKTLDYFDGEVFSL